MKLIKFIFAILLSTNSLAQTNFQIIASSAAGGGVDAAARHLADFVSKKTNNTVTVINKPGAESLVASNIVANSSKDGSVIGFGAISDLAVVMQQNQLKFDIITATTRNTLVLVANPNTKLIDFEDFVIKAKNNSYKFGWGATNQKIAVTQLVTKTKTNSSILVPYKSAPAALNDLLGGHIDVAVVSYFIAKTHIKDNKLILLATSSYLEDYPNVAIFQKKYNDWLDFTGFGVFLPKNSDPKAILFWSDILKSYLTDNNVLLYYKNENAEILPNNEAFMLTLINRVQIEYSK